MVALRQVQTPAQQPTLSKAQIRHAQTAAIEISIMELADKYGPLAEDIAEKVRAFRHALRRDVETLLAEGQKINFKFSARATTIGGFQLVSSDRTYVVRKVVTPRSRGTQSKTSALDEFLRVTAKAEMDKVAIAGTIAILKKPSWSQADLAALKEGTDDSDTWKKYREFLDSAMAPDAPIYNYSVYSRDKDGKDVHLDISGHDYLQYEESDSSPDSEQDGK